MKKKTNGVHANVESFIDNLPSSACLFPLADSELRISSDSSCHCIQIATFLTSLPHPSQQVRLNQGQRSVFLEQLSRLPDPPPHTSSFIWQATGSGPQTGHRERARGSKPQAEGHREQAQMTGHREQATDDGPQGPSHR